MCDYHITAWMQRARDEGRLPNRTYVKLLEEHVRDVCPSCGQEYRAHVRGFQRISSISSQERQEAAEELAVLLALPAEERAAAIQRARQRFRSPALARLLVDRSLDALPHDPRGSLEAATLAVAIAERSGRRGMGELHVLALGHQGNALRALGRIPEAAGCFERARCLMRRGIGSGRELEVIADVDVYAKLAWFEGMYHRELGQWHAAEERLNRAVFFFALGGDDEGVNRVVLSLAALYAWSGAVEDALDAVTKLLAHVQEAEQPQLYWIARFNHASYLVEAGLCETAKQELAECLASRGFPRDGFMKRRSQWLGGRIDRELGDLAAAERKLGAVRAGYLEEGSGLNMALASLDLALVYLAQGRTAELKRVAEELTLIFGANDLHREALTALTLFQEAVRQEQVGAAYLLRLRKYLERTRYNAALQFEQPS